MSTSPPEAFLETIGATDVETILEHDEISTISLVDLGAGITLVQPFSQGFEKGYRKIPPYLFLAKIGCAEGGELVGKRQ